MMASCWLLAFALLFMVIRTSDAQSFTVDASPTEIKPGKTEILMINCSLSSPEVFNMRFLYSLILSHLNEEKNNTYEDLASIATSNNLINFCPEDAIVYGNFDYKKNVFLSVQWSFPYFSLAGEYKCEAHGLGSIWRPMTLTANAKVDAKDLTLNSLSEQLRLMHMESRRKDQELDRLIRNNTEMEGSNQTKIRQVCSISDDCNELKLRLDNITRQMDCVQNRKQKNLDSLMANFYQSEVYEGRRYYLTKNITSFNKNSAENTCEYYGGYLVEIDNDFEWNFIKSFLNQYVEKTTIWIQGIIKSGTSMHMNTRLNTSLTYFNWAPNNNIPTSTSSPFLCIVLNKDWRMYGAVCTASKLTDVYGYICEISEDAQL